MKSADKWQTIQSYVEIFGIIAIEIHVMLRSHHFRSRFQFSRRISVARLYRAMARARAIEKGKGIYRNRELFTVMPCDIVYI